MKKAAVFILCGALLIANITAIFALEAKIPPENAVVEASKDTVVPTSSMEFYKDISELVDSGKSYTDDKDNGNLYKTARLIIKSQADIDFTNYHGVEQVISDGVSYYIVQFESDRECKEAAEKIKNDSRIQYVEPDVTVKACWEWNNNISSTETSHNSWGTSFIGVDEYSEYAKGISDKEIVVAVIDTGTNMSHSFMAGRTVNGYDFVNNDSDPSDDEGHGSHVSGTVIDCTINNKNIKVMPVKVLGADGSGSSLNVASGIRYAADNGADVINLSLSGPHSMYKDEAINYALSKGVTCVVASGNEAAYVGKGGYYTCPAHIPEVITVGAVDNTEEVAWFSNYGPAIDVVAPGVNISSVSVWGGYQKMSGTSMAAPHISGCAALIKQANPNYSPEQIQSTLKDCSKDLGPEGYDEEYGYGLPQMDKLIKPTVSDKNDDDTPDDSDWSRIESLHNYKNNTDQEWHYKTVNTQVDSLEITFDSKTQVEANYDFIYILDENRTEIGKYTGTSLAGKTIKVPGRGFTIRLVSDSIIPGWGFKITNLKENIGEYKIEYNPNGGEGAPEIQTKGYGEQIEISRLIPTRSHVISYDANGGAVAERNKIVSFTFRGWNTDPLGNGTLYYPGDAYNRDEALSLFAVWSTEYIGELPQPQRNGYQFEGWFTDKEGGEKVVPQRLVTQDVTVYAHWKAETQSDELESSHNYNNNTNKTWIYSAKNENAARIQIYFDQRTSTEADYDFIYIFDKYDREVGKYTGTQLAGKTVTVEGNGFKIKLVSDYMVNDWGFKVTKVVEEEAAVQDSNSVKVSLNTNGGYCSTKSVYVNYNQRYGSLPAPEREGYEFGGWYTRLIRGTRITENTIVANSAAHTLYAHWIPKN